MKVRVVLLAMLLMLMVAPVGAIVLNGVALSPDCVAAGGKVLITVTYTSHLYSVVSPGIQFQYQGSTQVSSPYPPYTLTVYTWTGLTYANPTLGSHSFTVVGNPGQNEVYSYQAQCTYKTMRVFGTSCKSAADPLISTADRNFLFKLWGKVTVIDSDSFWLDDGSGTQAMVSYSGYQGIANGSQASVCGSLNPSTNPTLYVNKPAVFPFNMVIW